MINSLKKITLSVIDLLTDLYWRLGRIIKTDFKTTEKLKQLYNKFPILKRISNSLKKNLVFSNKIISIKMKGGLGNQLFQISTVLAYGWKHSITPIFKKIKRSPSRIDTRPVYWDTVFRKLNIIKYRPYNLILYQEKQRWYKKIPPPKEFLHFEKSNGIIFNGYFGSYKYFNEYREKLLNLAFYMDPLEKEYLKKKHSEVFSHEKITISLHLRRDDRTTHPEKIQNPNLWKTDYYQKSIAFFEKKFGSNNIKIVVFSTSLEWVKNYLETEFPHLDAIFPQEKDYLELHLMSCCDHQILANSTFSWWGAYLNINPDKIVIAPKNWADPFYKDYDFIYMDDWIKM